MKKPAQAKPAIAATVEDYLAALPDDIRTLLQSLRQTILSSAPGVVEKISYQIPMYQLYGPLVAFAAFKRHCGLYIIGPELQAACAKELQGFDTDGTKDTVRFTVEKPLPAKLVRSLVKARIAENKARSLTKTKPPAKAKQGKGSKP